MTTVAIDLNDAGLLVASDQGTLVGQSPGYALLDGKDLSVGAAAQTRSRLKPRWTHNRFWDELDSNPMPRPFPRSLSRADVAHNHLVHLRDQIRQRLGGSEPESVLLAVPGSFSVDKLGLILGIARACEIAVTGMVDAAVAATATVPVGRRVLHLDALLHRMVWTELVYDGELVRRRIEVLETGGLASIVDAWAKKIAKLLVHQTRFDPFHHGSAEQTLYDRLPGWLAELANSGRVMVTLESEGKEHAVELGSDGVERVAAGVTGPVVEMARALVGAGESATLMVSERAAVVPGLIQQLTLLSETEVSILEKTAAAMGALRQRSRIESPGGDLAFVVRLPVELQTSGLTGLPAPPDLVAPAPGGQVPTHVLFEGIAHPISMTPLWLGSSASSAERGLDVGGNMPGLSRRHCAVVLRDGAVVVEDHSAYGTYVNGRQVEGPGVVSVGDRLRLGSPGVELLLIALAEDDV